MTVAGARASRRVLRPSPARPPPSGAGERPRPHRHPRARSLRHTRPHRHTRAKPDPPYPRKNRSVIPVLATGISLSSAPKPRAASRPPAQESGPAPTTTPAPTVVPARNQIRHTRAKPDPSYPCKIRSVIPALAAGISPSSAPKPRAASSHPPAQESAPAPTVTSAPHRRTRAKPDPSYPCLPRVSRRVLHPSPARPPALRRGRALPRSRDTADPDAAAGAG